MRFATTLVFVLAICLVGVASAQTPYVAVLFDEVTGFEETAVCPGAGVLDTLYVFAYNFNAFISGIEYGISYPAAYMAWLADFDTQPVTIGTTPTGISMGWSVPQNGFFPIGVHKVLIQWTCSGCAGEAPLSVVPHPLFGFVRATRFPDQALIDGVGLTSLVCPTIAAEESTWGQIKSLYED